MGMEYTHRSAIDNLHTMTSTTYCDLMLSINDASLSNDPTCPICMQELLRDRKARGKARDNDPQWLKDMIK